MYPLLFAPVLIEKVWGGDRLRSFAKVYPQGAKVGESWEVADLASTAASGAGGGAISSVVTNGPLAGRSLRTLVEKFAAQLAPLDRLCNGGYPLLVKFLDATQNLSVQVHPSPQYAANHQAAALKSECWYILAAKPGARIYKGLAPGTTPAAFERAMNSPGQPGFLDMLAYEAAVPGECHYLPSGTCHALGEGVLVLEVQTASDTTFRVFDWGRTGRELHPAQALQCIDFDSVPPAAVRLTPVARGSAVPSSAEVVTPDFRLHVRHIGPEGFDLTNHRGPFTVTRGRGQLVDWLPGNRPLPLRAGHSGLMPTLSPMHSVGAGRPRLVGDHAGLEVLFTSLTSAFALEKGREA